MARKKREGKVESPDIANSKTSIKSEDTESKTESVCCKDNTDCDLSKTPSKSETEEKHITLSSFKEVLGVITMIGSLLCLGIISIRAYSFSSFYGIPFTSVINTQTTYEMIIRLIPVISIAGLICIIIMFARSSHVFVSNVELDRFFVTLLLTFLCIFCGMFMYYYITKSSLELEGTIIEWLSHTSVTIYQVVFTYTIALVLNAYNFRSFMKAKEKTRFKSRGPIKVYKCIDKMYGKRQLIAGCLSALLFVSMVLMPYMFSVLNSSLKPQTLKQYEVVYQKESSIIDSEYLYVTVSNNSSGKLVMECSIEYDDEGNTELVIKKGRYQFIDVKDYSFAYCTFDDIICS